MKLAVVVTGRDNVQGSVKGNRAFLHSNEQTLFPLLEQTQDTGHISRRQAGLGADFGWAIALVEQLPNAGENFQRAILATSDVFYEAHDERFLITHLDHQGRDVFLAQGAQGIQAAFAAYQEIVFLAICLARRDDNWLLEPNGFDVLDDAVIDSLIALPRVEHPDVGDGQNFERAVAMCRLHAARLMRKRSAIP